MPATRSITTSVVLAACIALLAGCAPAAPSAAPTSAPPTATRTPVPTPEPTDPVADPVADRLDALTVEQKAAAVLMLHAPGTDPAASRALVDRGIAGVIVMGDNVAGTPDALAAFTGALQTDPDFRTLVAVDQEGGEVARLDWDPAPGAEALRAAPDSAATDAFRTRAGVLAASGINVNFGIVADVTDDPSSFIAGRVLGTDPAGAGARVSAAVAGEDAGVLSTLKHFPGHGAAPGDSHTSIPTAPLDAAGWAAGPAVPFASGIAAGAELVMTGHLAYPAIDPAPASLSPAWHRVLREDLGFDGVVVTDDMLMLQRNGLPEFADPNANTVRALAAGADLVLFVLPADPADVGVSVDGLVAAIAAAVADGRLPEARLDEAVERVLTLRRELAVAG